jgi:hypothetical protein
MSQLSDWQRAHMYVRYVPVASWYTCTMVPYMVPLVRTCVPVATVFQVVFEIMYICTRVRTRVPWYVPYRWYHGTRELWYGTMVCTRVRTCNVMSQQYTTGTRVP